MKRKIAFIFCLCFCINTYAQNQQDTILISEFSIEIGLPGEYVKKVYTYEEGVFYDYIIMKDSSVVTIHVGTMVSLPLIEKSIVISSCLIGNMFKDETGKNVENDVEYYCRELNIFPYHLNISYDKVSSRLKNKYDQMINNIKVFENPIERQPSK